jgi:hypothetical protein
MIVLEKLVTLPNRISTAGERQLECGLPTTNPLSWSDRPLCRTTLAFENALGGDAVRWLHATRAIAEDTRRRNNAR